MDDTSPEIKMMLRQRYAQMTPAERFLIGVRMFETARVMALSSFPRDLTPLQRRRRLCERLYGRLADEVFGVDPTGPANEQGPVSRPND